MTRHAARQTIVGTVMMIASATAPWLVSAAAAQAPGAPFGQVDTPAQGATGVQGSIAPDGAHRLRLAVVEYPWIFGPCMVVAVACWSAYVVLRRRTKLA